MYKLILLLLISTFLGGCAGCPERPSYYPDNWCNAMDFFDIIILVTPIILCIMLLTRTTIFLLIITTISSFLLAFFTMVIVELLEYNIARYIIILPIYLLLNAYMYAYSTKNHNAKLEEKKLQKKQQDLESKQDKERLALEVEHKANQELLHKAENGDHVAALELSRKNKDNNIEAYYWNLIAEASGSKEAITNKSNILNEMSDLQINIAQERFKKWLNNKIGINVSNNYAPFKTQSSFGGYVYIMTCDKWIEDGLVKIGKSNNIERRLNEAQKEVQGTYSPNPPIIKVYHHQFSRHYDELEKHIHLKLQDRRFKSDTSTATEFFRLTPEEAKAELDIAVREIEEKMAP